MTDIFTLTCELLRRCSITPEDAGCQALIADRLRQVGFVCENLPFGRVNNLWATHGHAEPVLVFLGHTDVVPPGEESNWTTPPFDPVLRNGRLYGRGAADMKGAVAAMTLALEAFVRERPQHIGTVALLLTSDEEGEATQGIRCVVEEFRRRGQKVTYCLVGEPSSNERLGDTIRIGRRGSLSGRLTVQGVQGHVAYPEKACNPIHRAMPALNELVATQWDEGNIAFPATSLQISNIYSGTNTNNVIPGTLEAWFNFRYSTASSAQELQQRVETILRRYALNYTLDWKLSGEPFLTQDGRLRDAAATAIRTILGIEAQTSTGGGTSDGRFIAPLGAEVIEFGPVNSSIHKVDEWMTLDDLQLLPLVYQKIIKFIFNGSS